MYHSLNLHNPEVWTRSDHIHTVSPGGSSSTTISAEVGHISSHLRTSVLDNVSPQIRAPPTSATWQHRDTGTCGTRTLTSGVAQKVRAGRCRSVRQAPCTHRRVSDSNDSSSDAPQSGAQSPCCLGRTHRTHQGPGTAAREQWICGGRPLFLYKIARSPSPASPARRCPSPQPLARAC